MTSTALVPTGNGHAMSPLERENRELRRQLLLATDDTAGDTTVGASSSATLSRYHVERMVEGFWDGKYRARCGFRVLGLYDTEQEAANNICLDFAAVQARVKPRDS